MKIQVPDIYTSKFVKFILNPSTYIDPDRGDEIGIIIERYPFNADEVN